MTDATYTLGNGLQINAENPETHKTPKFCRNCQMFYYFKHVCPKDVNFPVIPHTAMKRGMKGYFDGKR